MAGIIFLLILVLPLSYILRSCWCLWRNVAAVKATGIPYVVLPWSHLNVPWAIMRPFLIPYLNKMPFRECLWYQLLSPDWYWLHQYSPFHKQGADTFITVSPARTYINTADAAVIDQITKRRNDFPKPTELYVSLDLYGTNLVSTEGQAWRRQRKLVSPSFNEKNNRLVWSESLGQAQAMVNSWIGKHAEMSPTLTGVANDTMRLSLHVISCAGFGVNLSWPELKEQHTRGESATDPPAKVSKGPDFSQDHAMNYTDALGGLLHNIIWLLLFPVTLLKHLPFKLARLSYMSYTEWGKYLQELFDKKKEDITTGKAQEGMDLMGALLKGAGVTADSLKTSSEKHQGESAKQLLTASEIMGNAFVFLLAGHETAANSIHFSCVYLALNPASQRRLQVDLDRIFNGRPINEWDYDRDFNALFGGMAGAVLAEELRLLPPVPAIPKCVPSHSVPQFLTIKGQKHLVPPKTYISLVSPATHRNPNQWPSGPPSDPANPAHPSSNTDNDLEEFKPERWIRENEVECTSVHDNAPEDAPNTATGVNVAGNLFSPPKGAYIPFSEGYRACLGRRFAQVEVLAVLAVIFSQFSIELAVDAFASDEEVLHMSAKEKEEVWHKAEWQVRKDIRENVRMIFTMQLRDKTVPLRIVKRGKERFYPA